MSVQANLIAIKYVGNKTVKYDTVCHSPTTWTPGATRAVGPDVAGRLLAFPNIWIEGKHEDIDLPSVAETQKPVAPMAPTPVEKPKVETIQVPPKESSSDEPPAPDPEPKAEEAFSAEKLLARPFLAVKNGLSKLSDMELDEVNALERKVKKRPGYIKAIQDELEKRAG